MLLKKRLLILPLLIGALGILSSCSEAIVRLVDDPPVADAGESQLVNVSSNVVVDAGASSDPDGDPLSYFWQQTGGEPVILTSSSEANTNFTAPADESDLSFTITVTDSSGQVSTDSTIVYVRNMPEVELVLNDDQVTEADASLQLRFLLDRANTTSSTVNLKYSGSATRSVDYYSDSTVTIPAGATFYDREILTVNNELNDGNKTIGINIDSGSLLTYDSSLTYTITIVDDDTTPVITSASSHTSDDKMIDTEYTLSATDDDGDTLTYSIIGGDDDDKFLINATSGALSFSSSYFEDFYGDGEVPLAEQAADANADNVYELQLRASDDGFNYADIDLNITLVENNNSYPPVISTSSAVETVELSSSTFYTAAADDIDGSDLIWSISGKDGDHLQITNGEDNRAEISFAVPADYENPLDINPKDNIYEINLSVTDGRYSDTQELNITVADVEEDSPTISIASNSIYDNNITLDWTAVDNAISYHIYQSEDESCLTGNNIHTCQLVISSLSSSFNTYVTDGLSPYTEYHFVMVAETDESYGDFTEIASATTLLATPAAVQLQALSNSAIHVSWEANADADYYNLFRYSNEDCDVIVNYLNCVDVIYQTNIEDALEFTDTGLERATVYYYQLEAVNSFSQSQPSEQAGLSTAIYHFYNDTGVDYTGEYTSGSADDCAAITDGSAIAGEQDCHHGRDSSDSITKTGAGVVAFDFTKIGSDGTALAAQTIDWHPDGNEAGGDMWSCVLDNTTGLLWEVFGDNSPTTYKWGGTGAISGGNVTYYSDWDSKVADANTDALCGKSDWRVPTIAELHGISYMNENASVFIDTGYFANTLSSYYYWSVQPYSDKALAFNQGSATAVLADSNSSANVRLVSGDMRGYDWSDSRYQDNGDGTIVDLETNLIWLKCVIDLEYDSGAEACQGDNAVSVNWRAALEYAHGFIMNEKEDWRLPNAKELQSLGVLDTEGTGGINTMFDIANSDYLHSESPDPANSANSMQLDIASGLLVSRARNLNAQILLVRDNQ